jgi:hypothetical protein
MSQEAGKLKSSIIYLNFMVIAVSKEMNLQVISFKLHSK